MRTTSAVIALVTLVALATLGAGCAGGMNDAGVTETGEKPTAPIEDSPGTMRGPPSELFFEDDFADEATSIVKWGEPYRSCGQDDHDLGVIEGSNGPLGPRDLVGPWYHADGVWRWSDPDDQTVPPALYPPRQGQCVYHDGKLQFRVAPFNYRGIEAVISKKKGGAEISSPAMSSYESSLNKDGENPDGWDLLGTQYQDIGDSVVYGFRFAVTDVSMLGFDKTSASAEPPTLDEVPRGDLVPKFTIFQQHIQNTSTCTPDVADPVFHDDHRHVSPSIALRLASYRPPPAEDGAQSPKQLRWEFRIKVPWHSYFFDDDASSCVDGAEEGTCTVPLWTKPFVPEDDLGREITVAVRFTVALQKRSTKWCSLLDPEISSAEDYADCRPSQGQVELFFDGARQAGTETRLPWVVGQYVFKGVGTQFNLCPSYPRLGVYAVGYRFKNWMPGPLNPNPAYDLDSMSDVGSVPMIGVDYSGFRIGEDLEAVLGDWGGVPPPPTLPTLPPLYSDH